MIKQKQWSRGESVNEQKIELNAEVGVDEGARKCATTMEVGRGPDEHTQSVNSQ